MTGNLDLIKAWSTMRDGNIMSIVKDGREPKEVPDPKNGTALTNGRGLTNGASLTSGPGMVNGLAYTRREQDGPPPWRVTGFHLFPVETSRADGHELPRGLGVRRDLINGFAIQPSEGPKDPPRGLGPLGRKKRARHRRLTELAEGPIPGEGR